MTFIPNQHFLTINELMMLKELTTEILERLDIDESDNIVTSKKEPPPSKRR